jgi:hypothetical protein
MAIGSDRWSVSEIWLHPRNTMVKTFRRGDHVAWNSEAGRVTGIIQKKITSQILFKGYKRHASEAEPQYIIKSDKTDHVAIHKASALTRISKKKVLTR